MSICVSVIIPAHNAAETLKIPLESLEQQTYADWEAIIVDDGSTDHTYTIASDYAQTDSRIRVETQDQAGVSAARNTGAQLAQSEWLLFLDSDDWIASSYLEKFTAHLSTHADVMYCGWVRIADDGTRMPAPQLPQETDLFPTLTRYCPFAMHSCLVRRVVFLEAGGFDTSFKTCEDWDLWQRIARQGKKFSGIPDILAFYQMRAGSLSRNAEQFLKDGLRILDQGLHRDLRVTAPLTQYQDGLSAADSHHFPYYFVAWAAGLLIGAGEDARPFIPYLNGAAPGLTPSQIADALFESILLPTCSPVNHWWKIWPTVQAPLADFLSALEAHSQTERLTKRVSICLERLIIEKTQTPFPIQVGETYGIQVDVFESWETVTCPSLAERLICKVAMAQQLLGTVEIPICDGTISPMVIRDQIANKFWWPILGYFFEHHHYRADQSHDQNGWLTFLRGLWNRPKWSNSRFYNPWLPDWFAQTVYADNDHIQLDIMHPLPNIIVSGTILYISITLAGIGIGQLKIPTDQRKISAQQLRVALTVECGFELGRAVVRDALLGQALSSSASIRHRVDHVSQQHKYDNPMPLFELKLGNQVNHSTLFILGSRGSRVGNSSSRWAILPTAAVEDMIAMTRVTHEPIAQPLPSDLSTIQFAAYAPSSSHRTISPELIEPVSALTPNKSSKLSPLTTAGHNNRQHFESIFAAAENPWQYTTQYEQKKYEQTLSLLPSGTLDKALELACAEGHFTSRLAPKVRSLIATDISQIAVERAAQRCTHLTNVQFQQLDLAADPFPKPLNLIVCSEVLYYIGDRKVLREFAQKVADALEAGGYFLTAHAHLVVDEPSKPGFNWDHPFGAKGISDTFKQVKTFSLIKEIHTPLYRIQLFQKQAKPVFFPWQHPRSIRTVMAQPTDPPERVADTVMWQGGRPKRSQRNNGTSDTLPILTYHRILSPETSPTQDWYLNVDIFESQLRYLRDAGYHSISLAEWEKAILTQTPVPKSAVVLTFDDGYLDFYTLAYPLLKAYGFSATVFLVADAIGQSNQWDACYGETVPLMDWSQILQLQAEGIEFGSHTHSHRPLTGLSLAEIVQEGVKSRTILSQKLGSPVQSIAYPYGDTDETVEHLMGACGYTIGLTCRTDISRLQNSLLSLPRLEVKRGDRLQDFISLINQREDRS